MSSTGKILLVGIGGTVLLGTGIHFLVKTSNTAARLVVTLKDFSFATTKGMSGLGINIPNIYFSAKLAINNPTDNDLKISQPFLKVFYQNNDTPIGVSVPSDTTYLIKAKQITPIEINVEFASTKILPQMPDVLKYILKRTLGEASTRKVKIEMQVSGNGINQTQVKEVAI